MTEAKIDLWLEVLGYEGAGLHRVGDVVLPSHSYAPELHEMLHPTGAIRAKAVFDVEGMPTIAFFEEDAEQPLDAHGLDQIRQCLWNQNLISVILVIHGDYVTPLPVSRKVPPASPLPLTEATSKGLFSAVEICSNAIQRRLAPWFKPDDRVDHQLLANLSAATAHLEKITVPANSILAQMLFIAFLEHRNIISPSYRAKHGVGGIHDLIARRDKVGISALIQQLHQDFGGDFLAPDSLWDDLPDPSFDILGKFLSRVGIETGPGSCWNIDFSHIPVELLSGLAETFIGNEQGGLATYYTPRNLATLVVDQALAESTDVLHEVIFDGACRSGILLTTAFRKLLGYAEAHQRRQLTLQERIEMLTGHIFGADINEAACRISAFSLYLALLERLQPTDIIELQENEQVKLPKLLGTNLFSGKDHGDYFSPNHPLLNTGKITLVLSNPPWKEPAGDEITSADVWASSGLISRPRRQLAGDFAQRSLEFVRDDGRVCLIMPVSQFLAPTSKYFIRRWLLRVNTLRLINFGDLQQMIFQTASQSCAIIVGQPRKIVDAELTIPIDETFEYWVPKADLSLMLGRLPLQSGEKHRVQTQAVFADHSRLVALTWGDQFDLSLCRRLCYQGTFSELLDSRQEKPRWVSRKGFHRKDAGREPVSAESLQNMPFIPLDRLKTNSPVIIEEQLVPFPSEIETVARITDKQMAVFNGPRILFPDGFSSELLIRACYIDGPASFTSSVGVISGPPADEQLLRFAAIYLRSDLAKYFLIMRAYQVLSERNRVTLKDIAELPFFPPDKHHSPESAKYVLQEVDAITKDLSSKNSKEAAIILEQITPRLNEIVFDYFGLSHRERDIVTETVALIGPSIRPRSYKSLDTPLQSPATKTDIEDYAQLLQYELESWTQKLGGFGCFSVEAKLMSPQDVGAIGSIKIKFDPECRQRDFSVEQNDLAVVAVVAQLQAEGFIDTALGESFTSLAGNFVWTDDSLYIIKPLMQRFWLKRCALKDASRIVGDVQKQIVSFERTI